MLREVSKGIVAVFFSVEVTTEMTYLLVEGGRVILLMGPEQLSSSQKAFLTKCISISPKVPTPNLAPVWYVSGLHSPVLNDRSVLTNHSPQVAKVRKDRGYTSTPMYLSFLGRSLINSAEGIVLFCTRILSADPVRSKAWVCGRSLAGTGGFESHRGHGCLCGRCVLSDRGLCDGPSTGPEASYREWCFWMWSRNLDKEEA